MQYQFTSSIDRHRYDCIVIGCTQDLTETQILPEFTPEFAAHFAEKLEREGDWVWHASPDQPQILLYYCKNRACYDGSALKKHLSDMLPLLFKQKMHSVLICLPLVKNHSPAWQAKQMILHIDNLCYDKNDFRSDKTSKHRLTHIDFLLPNCEPKALEQAIATAEGIRFTKHLADLPANYCTPIHLAEAAQQLEQEFPSITAQIFDKQAIEDLKMGALLAVAQGSHEPPRFIEIRYQGLGLEDETPPYVLIGKGITFDSGGLSIKPGNMMEEMKYDMAGAASVLGIIKACALLKLPINVVGLLACAENLPSGSAVKPGDVITSMSGQTIEIINTDAEGRLALADALTYAERFNPQWVIDLATLTGAMVVALGSVATGFMTPDERLAQAILQASSESQDKVWRMPLDEDYQTALSSPIADMVNATFDRTAGAITAACFLSRFTKKYRWAHFDIAGTAWISGKNRQATGRPVSLIVELLCHAAETH